MEKLRYWTHKILPLIYDDSLSYYEVLSKVTAKINEIIDYVQDTVTKEIVTLIGKAFLDVSYDAETETITLYINTEDVNTNG